MRRFQLKIRKNQPWNFTNLNSYFRRLRNVPRYQFTATETPAGHEDEWHFDFTFENDMDPDAIQMMMNRLSNYIVPTGTNFFDRLHHQFRRLVQDWLEEANDQGTIEILSADEDEDELFLNASYDFINSNLDMFDDDFMSQLQFGVRVKQFVNESAYVEIEFRYSEFVALNLIRRAREWIDTNVETFQFIDDDSDEEMSVDYEDFVENEQEEARLRMLEEIPKLGQPKFRKAYTLDEFRGLEEMKNKVTMGPYKEEDGCDFDNVSPKLEPVIVSIQKYVYDKDGNIEHDRFGEKKVYYDYDKDGNTLFVFCASALRTWLRSAQRTENGGYRLHNTNPFNRKVIVGVTYLTERHARLEWLQRIRNKNEEDARKQQPEISMVSRLKKLIKQKQEELNKTEDFDKQLQLRNMIQRLKQQLQTVARVEKKSATGNVEGKRTLKLKF
jgi:hypothetical protein